MTVFPTGDQGQRYEISSTGYPNGEKTVMGWSDTLSGAWTMARSFRLAPNCLSTTIRDRWGQTPEWGDAQEYTVYGGAMR